MFPISIFQFSFQILLPGVSINMSGSCVQTGKDTLTSLHIHMSEYCCKYCHHLELIKRPGSPKVKGCDLIHFLQLPFLQLHKGRYNTTNDHAATLDWAYEFML